jgi:hypothetical protein
MMGSAYLADEIWAPEVSGITQHALALRLKKPQSFVAKYEGGERRLDFLEFIAISRALGADRLKLMASLVARDKGKSPGASTPRRLTATRMFPDIRQAVQRSP